MACKFTFIFSFVAVLMGCLGQESSHDYVTLTNCTLEEPRTRVCLDSSFQVSVELLIAKPSEVLISLNNQIIAETKMEPGLHSISITEFYLKEKNHLEIYLDANLAFQNYFIKP